MSWLNKQWSKLDFWDKEENERQKQQFAKPTPQTKPAVPQSVDWKTKNAKFGVLANNPQRQKSFLNDIAMPNQAVTNARNIASGIVEAPVKIGKTLGKGFWETGDAAKQLPGALLGKNNGFKESLDQSIIGGVGRFGQSLASAGLSPVTNSLADRERKRSERLLIPAYENLYRASGADPRLGRNQAEQEALGADYTIRTDPLNRSNIGVNDSLGTTARKVTAQAGEAILDTATAPAMGLATGKAIVSSPTKQFLKSTLDSGLLSGGGNLLYTAQQDNVTPLDYAKSGGLGFATGIALPVGTRLVKEMPRFVDQNIPRTAFRETELGKRATWVTPNRKLAEQFKRPETVAEAYTYRKKDILDPSDNRTRSRLIERYGENKINNLTSDTLNGRFNDQLEAPARKIAKEMGYKGAAFDEPILPSDPRSLRRNPLSINVFDQSALKSKQLLNEGGYINPSEILDSTKRAVKQLKNNGSGKAMSVEKPVDLKAEVKAPKVPRGNIEEAVVNTGKTTNNTEQILNPTAPKKIEQLQAEAITRGKAQKSQPQPKQQKQPTQKYQNGSLSGKQTEVLPQKQITQPDKAKLQNKVSSDDTIPDVDNFIKEQTTAQHIKPQKLGVKDRLMRTWIDSLAPAEDRFSQAVKDGKISQETLEKILVNNGKSLRAGTRANQDLIDSGLVDLIHKMPKKDYDNLGQVLIARHSDDLRANGIETGRKPETDAAILKKYGKQYEKQVEQFKKSTDFVLDESVKSGLISKDTAKLLRKKYPNYVPMNRVFDEMEATGSFGSNQVANLGQQTVVRKIKGSKRVVENPMESMIEKVQAMSRQSLRNEAATSWVDTLKELGEAELIKGDKKPGDSAISIFRNGTKETYKVDPVMEQAAKGLTKEQMGVINNAARKVSRVFKTGTTGVNLPFIMTNLARDQQTALLNMHKGEREVFTQLPKTIMETLGHGKLYDEAVKQGAVSTSFDMTKPNLKRTAENIRKKGASLGAFERIEDVIGRSEEFTRIQQYAATKKYWLKKGLSEEQAMNKATLAAQQNSADFSRSGDLGQIINAWLPYTNAGVQGTRAYLRAAYKNPQRYAVKAGALLVMPTIATTLYNTGTDERKAIYDDISDQDKMSSTIIVTPWAKKNEEGRWEGLIKVPKPPGISALLYPVEKGVASMRGLDPVGFNDIAKGILGFASPLGDSPNAAVSTITPQPIKPAVESIVNRDFFTGRDIVPRWLQNKPKSDQAYDYTSGTSRGIASATGQSPLSIEHLIRGYTGEVGLQGLNLSDNILNRLGVIPKEQIGGRSVTSGFSRRFTQAYDKGRESKIADGSAVGNINAISGKDASVKRDGKYVKVSDLPLGQRFQESLKNLGESGDSDYIKRNVAEIDSEMNKIYQKYGLPPAKTSTAVAKKWAEYDNRLKDGKISPLKQPAEERKLLRDTYKLQTQGATRDFLSVSSDNDMRQAIKDGLVDKKTLKSAIELDNFLVANGLQSSPTIGKKLRAELGYSTPGDKKGSKKSVASGGGNKKIIDDMIKSLLASEQGKSKLNKDLRNLIEGLSKKQYAKAKKTVY